MPPSSKTSLYSSTTVRLIVINLITILVFALAFAIVINTFGRLTAIFERDIHDNMQMTLTSFNFGKKLVSIDMGIHNQEDGFLHDPEGTIKQRQIILAAFDEIIEEIKMTPNYFQQSDEFDRLQVYRRAIEARLSDNVKISKIALKLDLLNQQFLTILTAMEVEAGRVIVEQVLAGFAPTGLKQVTALIPLCREQILTARFLINRGVDDLNAELLVADKNSHEKVTLVGTVDLLSQTLQTMTSASLSIANKAKRIIRDSREYRRAAEDLGKLVQDKKKHHTELESQGQALMASLNRADQQMADTLEQATNSTAVAMDRSTKLLYLIAAAVLLVNLIATILIVLLGRRMAKTISEKDTIQLDLQKKMTELEEEVVRRREAENDARHLAENLEESVQTRTVELRAVNMELEALVYSMSHDLRTPLRGIAGFSNAMLDDCAEKLDRSSRHYLERIQDASILMGRTIDQILELSRFSREKLSKEELDLSGMVETIILELQRNDPGRSVQVDIGSNISAYGSEGQVRAILESLLGNAWKFTEGRGQAKIEFGSLPLDDKPVFYVKDNGVGFNMAYSSKMFGAFQRLHAAEEFQGAGIGLAIVQRLIQRHGGKVWGEGKEGEGATFYFQL